MRFHPLICTLLTMSMVIPFGCSNKQLTTTDTSKIGFDFSKIDAAGLRNGEVSLDYEYCIPADEKALKKVQDIDPKVKLMKTSKGRIGCTKEQWLCISNTHDPEWKEKLMAIAALDFVERMEETVWE